MKRLLLILFFVGGFCFGQNDSLVFENPAKVDLYQMNDSDFKKIKNYKDEFSGVREYMSKAQIGGERFWVRVIVQKDIAILTMDVNYTSNTWLFIEAVTVKINDDIYELNINNVNEDISLGGVSERTSVIIKEDFFNAIKKTDAKNDKVRVRYSGKTNHDFTLSKGEIIKMQRMFEFYEKLLNTVD
jgi:hypothetical protein